PRWLWVVIIVLLPVFGPVTWIATKQSRRSGGSGGRGARPGRGPRRPSGPVAPDDDPDFLWRLEQEKRRQARRDRGATDPPRQRGSRRGRRARREDGRWCRLGGGASERPRGGL